MKTKTINILKSKKNSGKNLEFVTDKKGNKTKVILSIDDFNEILENMHDLSIVAERRNEKYIPFSEALKKNGSV